MKTIGLFEAKTHLSEIVKNGEKVCLTNRGKEVAVIIPFEQYRQDQTTDIFSKWQRLKAKVPLGFCQEIIDMKNFGRK